VWGFTFFFIRENLTFRKVYFVGPDEGVKLQLFQTLTRNACLNLNLRSTIQILNSLPSRYTYWVGVGASITYAIEEL